MGTRLVGVLRVARLDHVVLHVRPEPVLRPEDRRERDARFGADPVEDVPEAGIDRRRVADHADPAAAQRPGIEETFAPKPDSHASDDMPSDAAHPETEAWQDPAPERLGGTI